MNKYTEDLDWIDIDNAASESDNEISWVSKSEIKRNAEALKDLGSALVELSSSALERIPLDDDLLAAILLAKRIKKEGRRRQLQLIGKMLRARDVTPIKVAFAKLQNKHHQQTALFHKLERWRDRLVTEGDVVMSEIITHYPTLDRQHLRTLVRAAQKEHASNLSPKNYREIFQYLKHLAEGD